MKYCPDKQCNKGDCAWHQRARGTPQANAAGIAGSAGGGGGAGGSAGYVCAYCQHIVDVAHVHNAPYIIHYLQ